MQGYAPLSPGFSAQKHCSPRPPSSQPRRSCLQEQPREPRCSLSTDLLPESGYWGGLKKWVLLSQAVLSRPKHKKRHLCSQTSKGKFILCAHKAQCVLSQSQNPQTLPAAPEKPKCRQHSESSTQCACHSSPEQSQTPPKRPSKLEGWFLGAAMRRGAGTQHCCTEGLR